MKTLHWKIFRKGKMMPVMKGYHITDKSQYSEIIKEIQEKNNFNLMDFHSLHINFT
jgi:hypothetical protein